MGKALIIAEKPSVASDISKALGKFQKHDDYFDVWVADLSEENCDVRRHAVDKLGELGDKRAINVLKVAGKKDGEKTSWWQFSCLGTRPGDAEKKILAHR